VRGQDSLGLDFGVRGLSRCAFDGRVQEVGAHMLAKRGMELELHACNLLHSWSSSASVDGYNHESFSMSDTHL
jgi:hypothetical protein